MDSDNETGDAGRGQTVDVLHMTDGDDDDRAKSMIENSNMRQQITREDDIHY